ncbi:MAG TPA: hypothetical protein P5205_07870 [Candidatus Paceibacterota bacterium]|nr:hypothetical protein [Verrucomicrobiota bacterium]HSA10275.1 hypothetical protein [Candidatus Paceibacterota bacterium]
MRIWNVGGGVLNGTASVTGPFAIKDATYSLKSGQGKTLSVRYQPAAPGTNTSAIVLSGADKAQVLLTGRAGVPPQPPQSFRVITPEEVSRADFIVRYSDDRTSYVVKPAEKEVLPRHAFYTPLTSAEVLNAAAKQPRRELMIIVLPRFHYHSTDASAGSALDETKRLNWLKNLGDLIKGLRLAGYQSLIFCEGRGSVNKIAGLRVVEGPEKALATSGG